MFRAVSCNYFLWHYLLMFSLSKRDFWAEILGSLPEDLCATVYHEMRCFWIYSLKIGQLIAIKRIRVFDCQTVICRPEVDKIRLNEESIRVWWEIPYVEHGEETGILLIHTELSSRLLFHSLAVFTRRGFQLKKSKGGWGLLRTREVEFERSI